MPFRDTLSLPSIPIAHEVHISFSRLLVIIAPA